LVAGLADTVPVAAGTDEASRRKNRRIELRVTGG
jgi:flagellar motor protein MotB